MTSHAKTFMQIRCCCSAFRHALLATLYNNNLAPNRKVIGLTCLALPMQSGVPPGAPSGWTGLVRLFPSAAHLVDTIKSTVDMISPLAGSKAAQVLRKGISDAFQTYTSALTAGFQKHQSPDGSFPYNLGMFLVLPWVLAPFWQCPVFLQ